MPVVDFVAVTDRLMSDNNAKDFEAAENVFAFGDMVVRETWDVGNGGH